jgi:nucleotide-binding universal stress UspA family protein
MAGMEVLSLLGVVALVVTLLALLLLRRVSPPKAEQAAAPASAPSEPEAPVAAGAEPYTVLMCVGNGQSGAGMVAMARALTGGPAAASRLYALHLVPPTERATSQLGSQTEGGEALEPLLGRARRMGLKVEPLSFASAAPGPDICRTAEEREADLILLGWHRPQGSETMLGGPVHEVMQQAQAHVGVLVERDLGEIHRVLVPFIGGRHDQAAIKLAQRLIQCVGADVTVLRVVAPAAAGKQGAPRLVKEDLFPEESGRVRLKVVEHASPEEAVLAAAEDGYDLVVVGLGAEWGLEDSFFGRHSERIIREAHTSVLVVRQPVEKPATEASAPAASEREAG